MDERDHDGLEDSLGFLTAPPPPSGLPAPHSAAAPVAPSPSWSTVAVAANTSLKADPPAPPPPGLDAAARAARDAHDAQVAEARERRESRAAWRAAATSTYTSLLAVTVLLALVRMMLPPLLESSRYSWYRGQLRAQHDHAVERLNQVKLGGDPTRQNSSLFGLTEVSSLVSNRVNPSVVHIDVQQTIPAHAEMAALIDSDQMMRQFGVGQGSGVIVDEEGYILTNNHVLEDAQRVEVYLSDRRRLPAKVVGSDPATDLAVLKVEADGLIPITWGDSETLSVGSPVWAVGSPFGLSGSITFGIISSKHRIDLSGTRYQVSDVLSPRYGDLLQSDVAVNPGNSGGPLVDELGTMVGINTAILGETYRGVSFAIPSRVAKRCYEQIRANGRVERGWLGVELQMAARDEMFRPRPASQTSGESAEGGTASERGALVLRFAQGNESPAAKAGIRIGDRIVEFGGRAIEDADHLIRVIGESDVGVPVPLSVLRDGEPVSLEVVLGRRPDELR